MRLPVRPRVALVGCLAVLVSGCTVELQHDLSEDDANDIYVLLQRNGIDAKKLKEEGGNEIRFVIAVAKQDVAQAATLLRANSLPRPRADGLGVFKKMKGMIPTQTEERAMFIEALAGEVSNTLNRYPGVLEARAIVMIPETNDLTQPDKKPMPSASVFLKYRTNLEGKIPLSEDSVKAFVANAVPEMQAKNVTVLMAPAELPEASADPEQQMQTVLGLRMTRQSADQFKVMAAVGVLLILLSLGAAAFFVLRGGGKGGSKPPPRTRTNAAEG